MLSYRSEGGQSGKPPYRKESWIILRLFSFLFGGLVEMVYTADLKSVKLSVRLRYSLSMGDKYIGGR